MALPGKMHQSLWPCSLLAKEVNAGFWGKNRKGNKKEFKIILMVRGQIHSRPELCLGISPLFLTFPEVLPWSNDQEADNGHVYPIHLPLCQPTKSHQWHTEYVQTTLCFRRSWPPFWRHQEPFYIAAVSYMTWLNVWATFPHLETTPLPNHGASGVLHRLTQGHGWAGDVSRHSALGEGSLRIFQWPQHLCISTQTSKVEPGTWQGTCSQFVHAHNTLYLWSMQGQNLQSPAKTGQSQSNTFPRHGSCSDLFLPWQSQSPKERYLPSHGRFTASGGTVALHHDFIGILLQGFVLLTRTATSAAKGSAGLFNII